MPEEKLIKTEKVYDGSVVHLRVDTIELPTGRIVHREIIEHSGAVAMVALDDQDNIFMVRQHRAAADVELVEIPAGGLMPDESREDCARRELQEEIGYYPEKLIKLGDFHVAASYTSEMITIYLVDGLRPSQLIGDVDEHIVVEKMSFDKALYRALAGELTDAKTVIGLIWAARMLGRLP